MANRVHDDGDWDSRPTLHGPITPEDLVETRSRLYHGTLHWTHEQFNKRVNRENFATRGPVGTVLEGCYLVETSRARDLGGGKCEFDRTYAELPRSYSETERFPATYQYVDQGELSEVTVSVNSVVTYTFYPTVSPQNIPLRAPVRLVASKSFLYTTGGSLDDFFSEFNNLAEDETLERWRGFIWRKKSRTKPARLPTLIE